jgi:hypothetical protein
MLRLHRLVVIAALSNLIAGFLGAPQARADDVASSCANTAVNGVANDCYTITPPFNDGSGITVNGVEGGGEWTGATTKNLTGDLSGSLKALRSGNAIYLLITVNDATYNPARPPTTSSFASSATPSARVTARSRRLAITRGLPEPWAASLVLRAASAPGWWS